MLPNPRLTSAVALLVLTLLIPARASDHPGNVFLRGQDVRIPLPPEWTSWAAIDISNKQIAQGASAHEADLGPLPVGYYELHTPVNPSAKITAAVVALNHALPDTPIALDAAMSWFYANPEQVRDACSLCRLAGVTWVRDRASWPELMPKRDTWAPEPTRYERTMRLEHEAGLKILQVNHISPPWAAKNPTHFPDDLRDVYSFYRGLAVRWKTLADAIEPWNEPDIIEFGGHTGCEIASFQKAAYLGLKAGNPDLVTNDTVFAIDRAETLDEFGANDVFPYFDRYDLHHYVRLPDYARAYARHRAQSAGRPMWTTEFNLTVHWSDEKTKEPSEDELRVQGFRVGKVFAHALHEGTSKAFYFILGDYVERNLQYGLVHADLTPRPAFVSFCAVGRLLNGAKPLGQLDLGDPKLKAFAFSTTVDGAPHETVVAWSETQRTPFTIPESAQVYDYLGRDLSPTNEKVDLTRETLFLLCPPGTAKSLKLTPPPAPPPFRPGTPSPIVLQLLGPTDFKQSAYLLDPSHPLHLVAYNFSGKPVTAPLTMEGATCDSPTLTLPANSRLELPLHTPAPGTVTARLSLGTSDQPIVSARLVSTKTP